MQSRPNANAVADRLAAAWAPQRWRDVHVLAAVSGGADSMALLRSLVEAKRQSGGAGRILAGHVNHGLRGAASDEDEQWLCKQCDALGVPVAVRWCDAAALAAAQGDGFEAAARTARYRLLAEMAEAVGARFVATAHTRDDQAETVLFQLVRGAGLRGLAGMRATRELTPSVVLVRPLLETTRADVVAYLQAVGQQWREDSSNMDLSFARNWIRREALPNLREHVNAEADAAIVRAASLAGEAQDLIENLADELLQRCELTPPLAGRRAETQVRVTLAVAPLAGQPELVVREALRRAWRHGGHSEQGMTNRWWRQLSELALSPAGSPLNLPGPVLAQCDGGVLVLSPHRGPG